MKISELLFIGIKGSVVALNRATGEQVWATHLKGYEFVNVAVEDEKVFATCCGEAFCLNPFTGEAIWQNRLKGFGRGLASIGTESGSRQQLSVSAEKRQRDEAASAGAAAAVM